MFTGLLSDVNQKNLEAGMNKETKEALEGSIKKWKEIVASTDAKDKGVANCPLCGLFARHDCTGCPVGDVSGTCGGSPYGEWISHHDNAHRLFSGSRHRALNCERCLQIAKEELAFLEGLR